MFDFWHDPWHEVPKPPHEESAVPLAVGLLVVMAIILGFVIWLFV